MTTQLNNIRISLKIDDLSNWNNNSDIILNNGEVALIRLPNDQIKIKIGDGFSQLSNLNYLNEKEFFTNKLSAYNAEFGLKNYAQQYSVAEGHNVSAYGAFQHAAGFNVEAISNETFAFVWNGKNLYGYDNRYTSHGAGSFSINPENGLSGFYIGEQSLANILNDKIYIDDNQVDKLYIKHVSQDEYYELVNSEEGALSNAIYIVSSDTLNMYGEQIKNVAAGTDLSDVVNLNQLCSAVQSIEIPEIPTKISEFENDLSLAKIKIDNQYIEEFEIKHVSKDEYYELIANDKELLSNVLYIISNDILNAYGQKIENVADGEKDTDAVNLGQLKKYSDVLSVNYETLCNLKETGKLITGKTYCLTDYYVGKGTVVTYKEYQLKGDNDTKFDILITAISPNILSEHCKAITYDNKEYEIWYYLKDETERFDYPDIFERGIIYRMIDENNNDFPYDFKSILINSEYSIDGNDCSNIKVEQNIIDEKISMNFCKFVGKCFNIKVGQHCYSSQFINSSNIIFGNYCQENYLRNTNDITFGNYCSENYIVDTNQLKFESGCTLNKIRQCNNVYFSFDCLMNIIGKESEDVTDEKEYLSYNISIGNESNNIYIGANSYNINIGKMCKFIIFGPTAENVYNGTHNVNVNNDVSLVKFFELPEDKQLQNIEIKSGIHSKDIYVTYENMLYREVLSTIAPMGAYNLTI